ncbi:hypothetical protein AKJ09_02886 [Labilithrix luteola]|uniref:Cyclic nucleotide-binding domain-containing protein n=1 Tax=Labilithrix luteola TaxID=1391654 RepID=A0A0K1PRT5_9BACT|nr:cyclic nucleotide-binding domain-containing protein [Labilithrix luteola]AKU96222.1 hypothetical protein AKJ09_02886 [Labilithrix luteola]
MPDREPTPQVVRELFLSSLLFQSPKTLGPVMQRIATKMEDVYVAEGESIYRIGEKPERHYFVVSGEVALTAPGTPTWTFRERSLIGTIDVGLNRPRARNAVAVKRTHLLAMPAEEWLSLLEDIFEFAERAIRLTAAGVDTLRTRKPPLGGFDPPTGEIVPLGERLDLVGRILLLRKVDLCRRAGSQALATIAELADERRLDAGEPFPLSDDRGGRVFVVVSGEIEVTRAEPELTGTFRTGQVVRGVEALGSQGDYEAKALVPSAVLSISIEDYFDVMEDQFDLARAAIAATAEERERLLNRQVSQDEV